MLAEDLQILVGSNTLDVTKNFYELIKDAPKEHLLKYKEKCTDTNLRRDIENVCKRHINADTIKVNNSRFSIESWFSGE